MVVVDRSDERAYYHQRISNADVNSTRVFIYPRLFSIQDMSAGNSLIITAYYSILVPRSLVRMTYILLPYHSA